MTSVSLYVQRIKAVKISKCCYSQKFKQGLYKEEIEEMVGDTRFELVTLCTQNRCATRLR